MEKSKKNGEAEYQAAVKEGKAITVQLSGKQWALGDLADKVEKVYGENRLKQFAEDINFAGAVCTLERCRDVCRAFPESRGRPRHFASAQLLAAHPDRFEIVKRNPDISKAEARELMRQWREENPDAATSSEAAEDDDDMLDEAGPTPTATKAAKTKGRKKTAENEWSGDNQQWHRDVVVVANKAIELAEVRKRCSHEQRRDLFAVIDPPLIETVREASEAFGELARWLHKLAEEAADTKIQEGRVKTSPKRAQEPRAEA
jgi:hypothetical protein